MPDSSRPRFDWWMLLGLGLFLGPGCGLIFGGKSDSDDDDDDQAWETGIRGGGDGADGGDGPDGVSPVITEGYAGYEDTGVLGITAALILTVEDPNGDVEGGTFYLSLSGGPPYEYVIGGEDVNYNEDTGTVSLIFSNVDPVNYTVEMQVSDAAGHTSNIWTGFMEG